VVLEASVFIERNRKKQREPAMKPEASQGGLSDHNGRGAAQLYLENRKSSHQEKVWLRGRTRMHLVSREIERRGSTIQQKSSNIGGSCRRHTIQLMAEREGEGPLEPERDWELLC